VIALCVSCVAMKRRHLLFAPLLMATLRHAFAADQAWSAKLLKGGFDGNVWWSGLSITLAPHWKTYWRVPGDGGIAPSLELSGDNIKSTRIDYPVPHRIVSESGTTIGYKDAVVFPFAVTPQDAGKPAKLTLKAFFGVCDEVCIPAPFEADAMFDPKAAAAPDQSLISEWQHQVPQLVTEGPVTRAVVEMRDGKPVLLLDSSEAIMDIFVEGNPLHYFGNPMLMRGLVRMDIAGAKSLHELRATPLRITMRTRWKTLEQVVMVV
jgi:DsbC/DsbD-like thiol-disulfide interchange protein